MYMKSSDQQSLPLLVDPARTSSKVDLDYVYHGGDGAGSAPGGSGDDAGTTSAGDQTPMTNQRVLLVVTASFALFAAAELVAAIASGSLSLLGDAAAMSVDVFSYLTNMIAEKIKSDMLNNPNAVAPTGEVVIDKRTRFLLEVATPCFSITCLLGVTAWITVEAINTLRDPASGDGEEDLNVAVLYGFACANFAVDIVSFWMFYRKGRSAFFTPTGASASDRVTYSAPHQDVSVDKDKDSQLSASAGTSANTNMISAFSHVGGDTLRTASIFVAALVSTITGAKGYLVDAWAAAIVSVTIVAMVVLLILQIAKAWRSIDEQP